MGARSDPFSDLERGGHDLRQQLCEAPPHDQQILPYTQSQHHSILVKLLKQSKAKKHLHERRMRDVKASFFP